MAAPAGNVPEHIPYKILSQQQTMQLTPDSRFVPVWKVSFQGPNGYVASIEVPESEYDAAHVDTMIQEALEKVIAVHELGPQPHPENLPGAQPEE